MRKVDQRKKKVKLLLKEKKHIKKIRHENRNKKSKEKMKINRKFNNSCTWKEEGR